MQHKPCFIGKQLWVLRVKLGTCLMATQLWVFGLPFIIFYSSYGIDICDTLNQLSQTLVLCRMKSRHQTFPHYIIEWVRDSIILPFRSPRTNMGGRGMWVMSFRLTNWQAQPQRQWVDWTCPEGPGYPSRAVLACHRTTGVAQLYQYPVPQSWSCIIANIGAEENCSLGSQFPYSGHWSLSL